MRHQHVAPRVGVWIETQIPYIKISHIQSHPVWVCGLKPWLIHLGQLIGQVAPRVGVWIETLLT